jgi:broad specificity phosphatase PhoE
MSNTQRYLILAKHSVPDIIEERPAREWQLSEQGRQRAIALGERLKTYNPVCVVSSDEPKALETGRISAAELGLPCATEAGLYEHERRRIGFLSTARFVDGVRDLFRYPGQLVFGDETADHSYERFASAIDQLVVRVPAGNIVVITHGTVISLFASRRAGVDGFSLWQSLELPSFIVLSLPGFKIVNAVKRVI